MSIRSNERANIVARISHGNSETDLFEHFHVIFSISDRGDLRKVHRTAK
jgi:hypothetical protein